MKSRSAVKGENTCVDILSFSAAGHTLGVELRFVREAFSTGYITPVPLAPECIAGTANLRGQVVTLVSISAFIPGAKTNPPLPGSDALLLEWSDLKAGFIVDRIIEVYRLPLSGYCGRKETNIIFPGAFDLQDGKIMLLDVGAALQEVKRRSCVKAGMP